MSKITCIIPAYNEENRILKVLNVVSSSALIDEIIVVDDGSIDNTFYNSLCFDKVFAIQLDRNYGKAAAIQAGLEYTDASIIVLLDADLIGLTTQQLNMLVYPVIENLADMVIGQIKGVSVEMSGQRALNRSILDNVEFFHAGYGFERILNHVARKKGKKVIVIRLYDVTHHQKFNKWTVGEGIKHTLKYGFQARPVFSTGMIGLLAYAITRNYIKSS